MPDVQEITVRVSAKLFAKLSRLADQAYESPETYIESALAQIVRQVTDAQRHMRYLASAETVETEANTTPGYL